MDVMYERHDHGYLLSKECHSEPDDMEGQNCVHDLQFLPMGINWIATNASGLLGDYDASQHYIMNPGSNWIHPEPVPVPEWMHCPQTPQNYVDFLAERGYTEIQKQMSYDISSQVPSSRLADPSHLKQGWTEDCSSAFQAYSSSCAAESKYASGARRKRSREKAYAADRCRRLRISHWLDALQELVPHSKEVGRAGLLDEVIDHVQYLKYKVKDLCRSRLGGESTSNSFIFLEGHGHYLVQEQMLNGPLEEIMGKFIDVYPSAATELLQSRGLIVMPVNLVEGLCDPMETLDIQEKGAVLISK
ncbi:transcription factor bHLH66-like isoform X3 [Sesamum indicum]|uniref:Transcription factor bHLH66-like isoform X3 n=1 Tax=Sesamum indicum TaxID=4182 RepID=A0A8M8V2A2_SESIN|nr:transcription factor bHLH66-like isoform X3 [Sesamum indicum]